MFCHNVSLSIILKHGSNGNIKGNIELSDNVKASLTTSILNDFKLLLNKDSKSVLILGNSVIYGYKPEDYDAFKSFNHANELNQAVIMLESSDFVIESSDIASATDNIKNSYTLFYFPIFIKTSQKTSPMFNLGNSLLKISTDTLGIIDNLFSLLNIKSLALGYGYNDLLQDTLLNDFESLFNLEGLINNNEITIFVPYHFSFYVENGITIALFKSLISFKETFVNKKSGNSLVNEYITFTKNFRTGLAILKLLGRPYKILKSPIFSETIIDEVLLDNPLLKGSGLSESSDYIIEKIEGNTHSLLEVDNVEIDAYEDIQNGVIGVLVTWTKEGQCILRESVYPTKFETENFVKDLTTQITKSLPKSAALQIKTHDINDDDKRNLITKF
jgi:hypothetical protein